MKKQIKKAETAEETGAEESAETLEELFAALEDILQRMDEDTVSLEQAFSLYQRGVSLVKQCNDKIDYVEKEVRILNEAGEQA